jgi:periplasmic divalent cation tolerance protein
MYWQNTSFQAPEQRLFGTKMAEKPQHLLVLVTCRGSITAKKIANEVVRQKVGACVQVINGVQSFYRWVGKVENAEEQLLLIKTTGDAYEDLEKCIKRLHPYELPEIIAVPISTGLTDYLSWIEDCTKP